MIYVQEDMDELADAVVPVAETVAPVGRSDMEAAADRDALANCRVALTEALGLLTDWIIVKCPKKYVAEYMRKVTELHALGGLS